MMFTFRSQCTGHYDVYIQVTVQWALCLHSGHSVLCAGHYVYIQVTLCWALFAFRSQCTGHYDVDIQATVCWSL